MRNTGHPHRWAIPVLAVALTATAGAGVALASSQAETETGYKVNAWGQTYGSAVDSSDPSKEPDLIEAEATNGVVGYVLKRELDAATGADAVASFHSPEDALAWQNSNLEDRVIAVYDSSGRKVVGEFVVAGPTTQLQLLEEQRASK